MGFQLCYSIGTISHYFFCHPGRPIFYGKKHVDLTFAESCSPHPDPNNVELPNNVCNLSISLFLYDFLLKIRDHLFVHYFCSVFCEIGQDFHCLDYLDFRRAREHILLLGIQTCIKDKWLIYYVLVLTNLWIWKHQLQYAHRCLLRFIFPWFVSFVKLGKETGTFISFWVVEIFNFV